MTYSQEELEAVVREQRLLIDSLITRNVNLVLAMERLRVAAEAGAAPAPAPHAPAPNGSGRPHATTFAPATD